MQTMLIISLQYFVHRESALFRNNSVSFNQTVFPVAVWKT